MSIEADPGLIQQAAQWLWAALLFPLKVIWNKTEAAASRTELASAMTEFSTVNRETREMIKQLFANAEDDRRRSETGRQELSERIHAVHLDLLGKMK